MTRNRILDLLGIFLVGDGVVTFLAPKGHSELWAFGPRPYRQLMRWFAEHAAVTRIAGAGEAALGVWLALRQQPR